MLTALLASVCGSSAISWCKNYSLIQARLILIMRIRPGRNFEGQGGHSLDEETKWEFSKPITQLATCFWIDIRVNSSTSLPSVNGSRHGDDCSEGCIEGLRPDEIAIAPVKSEQDRLCLKPNKQILSWHNWGVLWKFDIQKNGTSEVWQVRLPRKCPILAMHCVQKPSPIWKVDETVWYGRGSGNIAEICMSGDESPFQFQFWSSFFVDHAVLTMNLSSIFNSSSTIWPLQVRKNAWYSAVRHREINKRICIHSRFISVEWFMKVWNKSIWMQLREYFFTIRAHS